MSLYNIIVYMNNNNKYLDIIRIRMNQCYFNICGYNF